MILLDFFIRQNYTTAMRMEASRMEWIIQNIGNFLVGILVFGAVVGAVLGMRFLGKKNVSKCSGCPYSGTCGKVG